MPRQKKIDPENMTDEEIAAFNEKELKRQQKRLKQQEKNRTQKKATPDRDPNVIRGIKGPDRIRCISKRKIGLDDPKECTSDIEEPIDIPKVVAKRLQASGAVIVEL